MLAEGLDLKKLKAFQLTATLGGLKAAAARLRLTVPAVSFQIRQLEKDLGVELFQRASSGLVLTKAGETFLPQTAAIFERVEGALESLLPSDLFSGRLSVSTSSDIVWYFTAKLSAFIKRYPGVQLRHHVYNAVQTLRLVKAGTIDVGIGFFPDLPSTLEKAVVTKSALSLLCARNHPLARRQTVRLDEIARHKLVLPPDQSSTRKIIDRVFAKAKLRPRDVMEVGSCQTARDFAANGVGVSLVHALCVSQQPLVQVQPIDVVNLFGTVDFAIVYRKDSGQSPLLRGLLDQLMAANVA